MRLTLLRSLCFALTSIVLLAAKPTDYAWFTLSERDRNGNAVFFDAGDTIRGPVRSNDTLHFRNVRVQAPVYSSQDTIITAGEVQFDERPVLGIDSLSNFEGIYDVIRTNANPYIPTRNGRLKTWIKLKGDAGIDVFQYPTGHGVRQESLYTSLAPPGWEYIWVDGVVEVEGTLSGALVIGASDDIYLIDDVRYTRANPRTGDFDEGDASVGMLGLVSQRNIIIDNNLRNGMANGARVGGADMDRHSIVITAALVCPDGSFTFEHQNDEWEMYRGPIPDDRGFIFLKGCIIQKQRGRLRNQNHGVTGYHLSLSHDNRFLRYPIIPFEPERHYHLQGNYEELTLDTYHRYEVGVVSVRHLTILTGANISFFSSSHLTIRESLDIIGNEDTVIVLKAAYDDITTGIFFEGGRSSRATLSHVRVEEGIELDFDADTICIDNSEFSSDVDLSGGVNVQTSTFRDRLTIQQTKGGEVRRCLILNEVLVKNRCSNFRLLNNTIVDSRYDGVVIEGGQDIVLTNNIIALNRQGIFLRSLEAPELRYNLVWNNSRYDYAGLEPGANDLSLDPVFINPRRGDYHLEDYSPSLDAGDPSSPRDPDGTRADIGAFWLDRGLGNDDDDDGNDDDDFPPYLQRGNTRGGLLASPNPFNSSTVIRFSLPGFGETGLRIYDLSGRLVADLVSGHPSASGGETADLINSAFRTPHSAFGTVVWDAGSHPAGIYIARYSSGSDAHSIKLVKVD